MKTKEIYPEHKHDVDMCVRFSNLCTKAALELKGSVHSGQ